MPLTLQEIQMARKRQENRPQIGNYAGSKRRSCCAVVIPRLLSEDFKLQNLLSDPVGEGKVEGVTLEADFLMWLLNHLRLLAGWGQAVLEPLTSPRQSSGRCSLPSALPEAVLQALLLP